LSNTLLIGEKHVPLTQFGNSSWDCSIYNGELILCSTRGAGINYPLARSRNDQSSSSLVFGSSHPSAVLFAFCDGSVHALLRDTDPQILQLLSNIRDGQVNLPAFD